MWSKYYHIVLPRNLKNVMLELNDMSCCFGFSFVCIYLPFGIVVHYIY